jgi:hypothetical protein
MVVYLTLAIKMEGGLSFRDASETSEPGIWRFRVWSFGPSRNDGVNPPQLSTFSAAIKASCGMSTLPNCRIFFLPSFCFSRSFLLRVTSPP